jgi:hypothetical protein
MRIQESDPGEFSTHLLCEVVDLSPSVTTQPDLGRPLAGRCVSGLGSRHDPSTIVPPRPA